MARKIWKSYGKVCGLSFEREWNALHENEVYSWNNCFSLWAGYDSMGFLIFHCYRGVFKNEINVFLLFHFKTKSFMAQYRQCRLFIEKSLEKVFQCSAAFSDKVIKMRISRTLSTKYFQLYFL